MSKFWYIPFSILTMNQFITIIYAMNIWDSKPIVSFDYSAIIIFASLIIAVMLEFVYLFIEKEM